MKKEKPTLVHYKGALITARDRVRQLENDLAAANKHREQDQAEITRLVDRVNRLTVENDALLRERDHHRRVWAVLEQWCAR